jgi:hypothetical protein
VRLVRLVRLVRVVRVVRPQKNIGRLVRRASTPILTRVPQLLQLEPGTAASAFHLRIEPITQAVAEHVEGEHGERDGEAREDDHPRRIAIEIG